MKTCCNCNISKEDSEFYKDSHSKDGLTSKCKECQKEYQRNRYQENRDEVYDYTPVEPKTHTCVYCNEGFKSKHKPKYCSKECKHKAKYQRQKGTFKFTCKGCGKESYASASHAMNYCTHECYVEHADHYGNVEYDLECVTCGEEFISNGSTAKYCSEGCKPPVYIPRCTVYYNECKVCNKAFTSNCKAEACSQICSNRLTYIRSRGEPLKEKGECENCGDTFVMEYYNSPRDQRYCSYSCSRAAIKRNRRYRKRNNGLYESVIRTKVFERDKWKCQDCGNKTPKELMGKGLDNSPTLDHVVPLSLGGPHTYGNVQLLCRSCNSIKSNNYEGQTVLL